MGSVHRTMCAQALEPITDPVIAFCWVQINSRWRIEDRIFVARAILEKDIRIRAKECKNKSV